MYLDICVYIYIHTHTYACTCTYTYTYTYTYTGHARRAAGRRGGAQHRRLRRGPAACLLDTSN